MVLICGHRKSKIFFSHEFLDLVNRVGGNAENAGTVRSEFFGMISKVARLTRAQRGSGGGVEPDEGTFAGEVSERDSTTTSEREVEVGGLIARSEFDVHDCLLSGARLSRSYVYTRQRIQNPVFDVPSTSKTGNSTRHARAL